MCVKTVAELCKKEKKNMCKQLRKVEASTLNILI